MTNTGMPLPDAKPQNWVDRLAPQTARPYLRLMRLDRPVGWWLLLFPCWWSAALAADALNLAYPPPVVMALFLVGAVLMRGAGCVYNDILDRDIDAQVARTRNRPLAAGSISISEAVGFLVALLFLGLMVLIQFNAATIYLGLGSVALIALYPVMKRITNFPQVVLGLAFSWGALLGWSALVGGLFVGLSRFPSCEDVADGLLSPSSVLNCAAHCPPLWLYAGAVLWTIGYDTIYALQDREDDALLGVGSAALLFGRRVRLAVAILYAGAVALIGAAIYLTVGPSALHWPAYLGVGLGALILAVQVIRLDASRPELSLALFRANQWFGWAITLGLLADAFLTRSGPANGGHDFARLF